MGLDAVVYRNKKNLPFDPEASGALLDTRTGEFYFKHSATEKQLSDEILIASSRRLGNVRAIESLSEAVERCLGRHDALILRKVLYSGTHAGDVIEPVYFDELRAEIAELQRCPIVAKMPDVLEFARDMQDLVEAGLTERNPIVFT
jgi:hypothetical protein